MSDRQIRWAAREDLATCRAFDRLLSEEALQSKLDAGELMVAEVAGEPIGYLRLEYIWSKVPYIGLVVLKQEWRGKGHGREILAFLVGELKARGHRFLLSSSQVNEAEPQAWHRAVGFRECGIIAEMNEGGIGEVFFRMEI